MPADQTPRRLSTCPRRDSRTPRKGSGLVCPMRLSGELEGEELVEGLGSGKS